MVGPPVSVNHRWNANRLPPLLGITLEQSQSVELPASKKGGRMKAEG
jgi:hypothetical protein